MRSYRAERAARAPDDRAEDRALLDEAREGMERDRLGALMLGRERELRELRTDVADGRLERVVRELHTDGTDDRLGRVDRVL